MLLPDRAMEKIKPTLPRDEKRIFGGVITPPIVKYTCISCRGKILSHSVNWSQDGKPLCPTCGNELDRQG